MQLSSTPASQPDSLPSAVGMISLVGQRLYLHFHEIFALPSIRLGLFVITKKPKQLLIYLPFIIHFLS